MKNIKTTLTKLYLYCSTAWAMAMCGIVPVYADTSDVFTGGGALVDNIVTQVTNFYTNKLFVLLLVVNLVLLAFTKNEKRIELLKKTLITICVVYALLKCYDVVTSTIDNLLNGTGLTNPTTTTSTTTTTS